MSRINLFANYLYLIQPYAKKKIKEQLLEKYKYEHDSFILLA